MTIHPLRSPGRADFSEGQPVYVVAELSANHLQKLEVALQTIEAAKSSGADAVKIQTFRADTITLDSNSSCFQLPDTSPWQGQRLYDLYQKAATPWDWHPILQQKCRDLHLDFFSSPFDESAVDFLEKLSVPFYKVASFEIVDIPLLRRIGQTQKPVIISTGMASRGEIEEAVDTLAGAGAAEIVLLKCTSAYPAPLDHMHLRTLTDLKETFHRPVGLSDHTLGSTAATAAVALGARLIEKHFILSRSMGGPDATFSQEPAEFEDLVRSIRDTEKALGRVHYGPGPAEEDYRLIRPSIFVVQSMRKGARFGPENIKTIRPGHGLHCRYYPDLIGRTAARDIDRGTPLSWDLVEGGSPVG